ncbi:MAG TPA: FAD-dependent oxidoreductase [Sphingomicrobium sp.]|jgi:glycine/D-amino acid oxidase-like deaminating enzyme|nr:FAD-dependent oxidoreductase [Sphingomicrobium sp.]
MYLDRRTFAAGSAALLSGCATVGSGTRTFADCTPLAPVDVDAGRVIRTVAGLRPYRASGFVVRREPLGDKALVHNYGHGGGGITLSWGSSRLATNLGLPGHSGPVAVIGAGALGLTTARLVQEAGFPVTVYAKALPPHTTSNIAGGQIETAYLYKDDAVTPEWRAQLLAAMDYSWRRWQIMVGDEYGIRWLPTYEETDNLGPSPMDPYYPATRRLSQAEHPFPLDSVVRFETMYVETGHFLRQAMRDISIAGGRFEVREFANPQAILGLSERLVFNCTGLGSRDLFGDGELRPARGQLAILLPQPEVRYALSGGPGYMFPRDDGIILGGTFELDQWDATPQPATIARLIARHKRFFGSFRCAA